MGVNLGRWRSLLSDGPAQKRMKRHRAAAIVEAARSPAQANRVGDVDRGRQPHRVHYYVLFCYFNSYSKEVLLHLAAEGWVVGRTRCARRCRPWGDRTRSSSFLPPTLWRLPIQL